MISSHNYHQPYIKKKEYALIAELARKNVTQTTTTATS